MPPNQIGRDKDSTMSHIVMNEETGELRSSLACLVCKKRKVKCTRELPYCHLCEQSSQSCTYPNRASRPGPKIGSTQSSRKRRRDNQHHEGRQRRRDESSQQISSPERESADRLHGIAPSPGQSVASASSEKHTQNMQSLSFIIHPSHECCSPEDDTEHPFQAADEANINEEPLLTSTSYALGLNPEVLDGLIDSFFQTFTAYRLFREPQFRAKLRRIKSGSQINALLAAMFAFSSKEYSTSQMENRDRCGDNSTYPQWSCSHFIDLALNYIDRSLRVCGDEAPPLCLLQALILIAHALLIQGVRGRAWRYLGTCVRIAYELNLHLVDAGKNPEELSSNSNQWCEDEERRRAWWAIWEMDVFASVIRRCPTAIDWSQNETFLPAEDERWYKEEPQKSCILASGLIERCKALQTSGNQSSKAWFILVNSLMKEAQTISSPVGINKPTNKGDNSMTRLSTLHHTLKYFSMALPNSLKYREQHLSFKAEGLRQSTASSPRNLHSAIFEIHLMSQLTQIMILKYRVFHNWTPPTPSASSPSRETFQLNFPTGGESDFLNQYFRAADDVLTAVNTSNENLYRYVNPFLANTVWLAAAIQLLHKSMSSDKEEEELISSKFEVLCMTYDRFVNYWEMSPTPRQNLETLQNYLKSITAEEIQITGSSNESLTKNDQMSGRFESYPKNSSLANNNEHPASRHNTHEISTSSSSSFPSNLPSPHLPSTTFLLSRQNQKAKNSNRIKKSTPQQDLSATQQYPTPMMAYDEVHVSQSMELQSADVVQDPCNEDNIFQLPKQNSFSLSTPRIDSGLLDSFNFMHNLGAATNIEFSSYLDEMHPGQEF